MNIAIPPARAPHERAFLHRLGVTVRELGHELCHWDDADFLVVWNGREWEADERPRLVVECGWLPRWTYQVSPTGINALHHAANPHLEPLSREREMTARLYLERIRAEAPPAGFRYADPSAPEIEAAPASSFVFVPLQVAADTNMASVPEAIRTPQGLIDSVESMELGAPVVFKKHPATIAHHEGLTLSDRWNRLVGHDEGTVHQWLKHPACRLVVTANSNVAHDALLWGVPVVTLGRGVWPDGSRGFSPFFGPPVGELSFYRLASKRPGRQAAILSYVDFLIREQWTIEDAGDGGRVGEAIRRATG